MRPTLLSGLDLIAPSLPEGWTRLEVPALATESLHLETAVRQAMAKPVGSAPLRERAAGCRSAVVLIEGLEGLAGIPSEPVMTETLAAVLGTLREAGVPPARLSLMWATGLGAKPSEAVLGAWVNPTALGTPCQIHDAEDLGAFATGGDGDAPFDLDRRALEADLVVMVSIRQLPTATPLAGLIEGLSTYRSIRVLHDPALSSESRRAWVERRAEWLATRVPTFGVFVALDSELLSPALDSLFRQGGGLGRAERGWNRLPAAVRGRVAAGWRTSSRATAIFAGELRRSSSSREAALASSRSIVVREPLDLMIVGIPDLSPATGFHRANPVLSAHLGLATLLAPVRPALAAGGVVALCSWFDSSGWTIDLPYLDFVERVLPSTGLPGELFARLEGAAAGRPEFVAAYRRRGALHGAHPFHRWYEVQQARAGIRRVVVVGGHAESAHRLGFAHSAHVPPVVEALRAELGREPRVGVVGWPAPLVTLAS